jgi:PQQ-dependent dehydrogenase (s-GDH family)
MKKPLLLLLAGLFVTITSFSQVVAGRMNEVFLKTDLVPAASNLQDPWEITYGPDDSLWITEAKGYRVRKVHPTNGGMRTVLDLTTYTPTSPINFRRQFASTQNPWPQGGLMGLAIHPDFMHATAPKKYVYLAYVRSYVGQNQTYNGEAVSGHLFITWLVRFTYDNAQLGSAVVMCDTLRGSNDHNSGRLIIAPEGGTNYLYYAMGDMGAGQFDNLSRTIKSQMTNSYEGKILRFNLESDGDAGLGAWIPNTNPYGANSAVWAVGMRNNQGFAFGSVNGTNRFYGSSHGPFSDDEINLLESGRNYGHPLVIGYSADGNYNNAKAGPIGSSLPLIGTESANATAIGSSYRDPIYSNYAAPAGNTSTPWSIQYIYQNVDTDPGAGTAYAQNLNGNWASEGYSGLDLYTSNAIPGWKNSLLVGSLKWGRVLRMKLNGTGTAIVASGGQDTVSYFGGRNRFRDIAVSPDGKDIYVVMDRSSTTSGPSANNPVVPACAGCVQRYTFLGYNHNSGTGKSSIPTDIAVSAGTAGTCNTATTVTINAANNNNNIWVPITGPDGNIVAEIKANGNNLGTVTTSFYIKSGSPRQDPFMRLYMNRSITITPQTQPSTPVSLRLYLTTAEFTSLQGANNTQGMPSGVSAIGDLRIRKNDDACGATLTNTTSVLTPDFAEAHGTGGYVLQVNSVSSFSSFYFGNPNMSVLPVNLLTFKGSLLNNSALLQWETSSEQNTSHFIIERSTDGRLFEKAGTVSATGNTGAASRYSFTDNDAANQSATTVYYRLRMVDIDGTLSYSKVVSLTYDRTYSVFSVYPNPIRHTMKVRVSLPEAMVVNIQVMDMQGRVIHTQMASLGTGASEVEIDSRNWPSQVYSVKLTGSDQQVLGVQKAVKL